MTRGDQLDRVEDALRTIFQEAQECIYTVLTPLDPWAEDFGQCVLHEFELAARPLWRRVQKAFVGVPQVSALQQAWAWSFNNNLWTGLLYRGAIDQGGALAEEAARLCELTPIRMRNGEDQRNVESLLLSRSAAEVPIPELRHETRFKGSIRLRYRLAYSICADLPLRLILTETALQSGTTDYQRRTELSRALIRASARGLVIRPLDEVELAMLDPKAQQLVLDAPGLRARLLGKALASRMNLARHVLQLRAEAQRIQSLLDAIDLSVRARRLWEVDSQIESVGTSALAKTMGQHLRRAAWDLRADAASVPADTKLAKWRPMRLQSLTWLTRYSGQKLPVWWSMTAAEIAAELSVADKPTFRKLPPCDLNMIRATWEPHEQLQLIERGRGDLVPEEAAGWNHFPLQLYPQLIQSMGTTGLRLLGRRLRSLKDARPWLQMMTRGDGVALRKLADQALATVSDGRVYSPWAHWAASSIGTPEWKAVRKVAMDRCLVLLDATNLIARGGRPAHPVAFCKAVAQALHEPAQCPGEPIPHLLAVMGHIPRFTQEFVSRGPDNLMQRVIRYECTPLAFLELVQETGSPTQRQSAWKAALQRVCDTDELERLMLRLPQPQGRLPWRKSWLELTGSDPQRAWIIAARRTGWLLQSLSLKMGTCSFQDALLRALPLVQNVAPREAALLELVHALGSSCAGALTEIFARSQRGAAAGHKLDGLYKRHLLPKKSGGNRVISAPRMSLKVVQRQILEKLIVPLGSHPAATGFVPGMSIVDNAERHVGQTIVVNADVSNCFPSVRWPLVLAALRRDLSQRLSQTAISMLVDICTAEGGLPIGAPTSPALLNRVLLRTDEILTRIAGDQGVQYSRYADDLSFSGDHAAVRMLGVARKTLERIGLALDPKKTNIFRRGRRQMVTGLVVNEQVSVPRRIRRRLRAAVHRLEQGQGSHWHGQDQPDIALEGRLSFIAMIHPQEGARLRQRFLQASIPHSSP